MLFTVNLRRSRSQSQYPISGSDLNLIGTSSRNDAIFFWSLMRKVIFTGESSDIGDSLESALCCPPHVVRPTLPDSTTSLHCLCCLPHSLGGQQRRCPSRTAWVSSMGSRLGTVPYGQCLSSCIPSVLDWKSLGTYSSCSPEIFARPRQAHGRFGNTQELEHVSDRLM